MKKIVATAALTISLLLPIAANAQTTDQQSQISALLTQIVSLQQQLLSLLTAAGIQLPTATQALNGQTLGTTLSGFENNFGSPSQDPSQISFPNGSISSQIWSLLPQAAGLSNSFTNQDGLYSGATNYGAGFDPSQTWVHTDDILSGATQTTQAQNVTTPVNATPSCHYYDNSFQDGATTSGDPCPGISCAVPAPQIKCVAGVWHYTQTNESLCITPGFILDTPALQAYRKAIGCLQ